MLAPHFPTLRDGFTWLEQWGVTWALEPVLSSEPPPFAAEAGLVCNAVLGRRNEFAAGRRAAHAALKQLGVSPHPLMIQSGHCLAWPEGFVGSISHTRDFSTAVTAPIGLVRSLGVDLEEATPLVDELVELVCCPEERTFLEELSTTFVEDAAKFIFSAKEAYYKAYYPLAGTFLNFSDVQLTMRSCATEFEAIIISTRKFDPARHSLIGDGISFWAQGYIVVLYVLRNSSANAKSRVNINKIA